MNYVNCVIRILILITLISIRIAISDLAENKNWPERVTEINHNRFDVAVKNGGIIKLPQDEFKLPEK